MRNKPITVSPRTPQADSDFTTGGEPDLVGSNLTEGNSFWLRWSTRPVLNDEERRLMPCTT